MKKYILVFLAVMLHATVMSQSVMQIKSDTETWLYGEGHGVTESAADESALNDLLSKISVSVRSEIISNLNEINTNGNIDSESNFKMLIKSYSAATLNNTERIVIEQEPDAMVMRYIRRSEIDKIFESRRDKAVEYVRLGTDALSKRQIDDALRYYYWALCLVRTLRYPSQAVANVDGQEQVLLTWIPRKIEEVCSNISISMGNEVDNTISLAATYEGQPIRSMDYSYNLGKGYGAIYSIKDGKGVIEMIPGESASQLTVKVEFEFRGLATVDREVESSLVGQADIFRKAYIKANADASSLAKAETGTSTSSPGAAASLAASSALSQTPSQSTSTLAASPDALSASMQPAMDKMKEIHKALTLGNPNSVKHHFTAEGYAELGKILSYGKYTINKDFEVECFADDIDPSMVVCRGVGCLFRFGNRRTFNEQLSFTFQNGLVDHVSLGLGKQMAEEEILKHDSWGAGSRKKLVSFLEDYRTAYATKDLTYLKRVFDDNAVIIVGKVLQVAPHLNSDHYRLNTRIVTTKYTKDQFVKHLEANFGNKEYINLHFSNCEVVKLSEKEIYGIQVRQDYYSNNYGDTGYLYLLVDLCDPKQPVIHVRSWQDVPHPDFGLIGPGDF